ncbi:MAG: hypothetical protein EON94_07915 [Caulobacteraceae bacterium]|nr:MAG: hypothetical protein EON94_07915 [Caulobacteraceae bacterium]
MKRLAAALALAALTSACSTTDGPPPVAQVSGSDTCNAAYLLPAIGQPASIIPTNLASIRIVDVKQAAAATPQVSTRVTVVNDVQEQKVRELRCG